MKVLHTKELGDVKVEIVQDEDGAIWGYRYIDNKFANRQLLEAGQSPTNTAEYLVLMSTIGGV
jgi:hypothetical protein